MVGAGRAVARDLHGRRPANQEADAVARAAAASGAVGASDGDVMAVVRVKEDFPAFGSWCLG